MSRTGAARSWPRARLYLRITREPAAPGDLRLRSIPLQIPAVRRCLAVRRRGDFRDTFLEVKCRQQRSQIRELNVRVRLAAKQVARGSSAPGPSLRQRSTGWPTASPATADSTDNDYNPRSPRAAPGGRRRYRARRREAAAGCCGLEWPRSRTLLSRGSQRRALLAAPKRRRRGGGPGMNEWIVLVGRCLPAEASKRSRGSRLGRSSIAAGVRNASLAIYATRLVQVRSVSTWTRAGERPDHTSARIGCDATPWHNPPVSNLSTRSDEVHSAVHVRAAHTPRRPSGEVSIRHSVLTVSL